MSVPDEIDDLIGVLRSPALTSELADENRSVAAMARAFQSSEGKASMHITSRRARIGVLIATGIIGFGGVAAAGPGGVFDANDEVVEEPTTTEAVAASTTTVEVTTTTEAVAETPPAATKTVATPEEASAAAIEVLGVDGVPVPPVDDPSTTFDERMCLEGNHGKTVSAVARGELVIEGIDVSDAAHSACGKQDAEAEAIEPEEENESVDANEAEETTDESAPAKEKKSGHSNGNGHGNGQSNGQGHGHGNGNGNGNGD